MARSARPIPGNLPQPLRTALTIPPRSLALRRPVIPPSTLLRTLRELQIPRLEAEVPCPTPPTRRTSTA